MNITSKDTIHIEESFKVAAGPGAGKTDFLVGHIKNVVRHSNRLSCARKVACITYTNTGVSTILQRLGKNASEKVEVSTIHSFLYKNIVKPYSSFIPLEYGVNCKLMTGHDDFIVSRKNLNELLSNSVFDLLKHPNSRNQLLMMPEQFRALKNWVTSMQCVYKKGKVSFLCDATKSSYPTGTGEKTFKSSNLKILTEHLIDLKKIYWKTGKIHHDDVLFFSVILIEKYPFILEVLRAKFPYIFIDEYQDTSPVQAHIVDKIKEKETIVGVIGDKAQSIFSFQGADPTLFSNFKVDAECEYTIVENHRSSGEIVRFLNVLRTDIKQEICNGRSGNSVYIIVGNRVSAYQKARALCENITGVKIESLSRDNITSNAMKKDIGNSQIMVDILKTYENTDSNSERRHYVLEAIRSIELSKSGKFKEAIKGLERLFRKTPNPKKQALHMLIMLLTQYSLYSGKNLLNFYELAATFSVEKLSAVRAGKVKNFYTNTPYQSIAICMNIPEDTSEHITIHKSKGNQFENVFVVGTKHIKEFLLNSSLENEEHRIAYVAFSRAEERLFIQFDESNFSRDDELALQTKFDMLQVIRI